MRPPWESAEPPGAPAWGGGGAGVQPLLALIIGPPGGTVRGSGGQVVTCARASGKACLLSASALEFLGNNVTAVEPKGVLVEQAHTNRIPDSQDLSSGWTQRGTAVVSTSPRAAPDGGAASRLSGLGNPGIGDVFLGTSGFTNGSLSPSFWIYRVSTTGFLRCQSATPAPGVWNIDLSLLPDAWVHVTAADPAVRVVQPFSTADGSGGLLFARDVDDPGPATIDADVWGVQEEDGEIVHSLVPTTTAAATGDQDVISLSAAALPTSKGSLKMQVTPLWSAGVSGVKTLLDARNSASSDSGLALYVNGDILNLITASPSATTTTGSSALAWTAGQTYQVEARWGGGNVYLYRDGVLVASDVTGTAVMPSDYGANLFLGIDYPGAGPLDANLGALAFYP